MSNDLIQSEGDDWYEHHRLRVDAGQGALRIDRYLGNRLSAVSRSRIQCSIKSGFVRVGGMIVKASYKVQPSDDIRVYLPVAPRDTVVHPEEMALDISYEDKDVLVVHKPRGMVAHPAHGNWNGTLLNGLVAYLAKDTSLPLHPYLVHRLDKDTSGLLLVAKHEKAQLALWRQFFSHQVDRVYHALIWGVPASKTGTLDAPLRRSARDRRLIEVCRPPHGKSARTHYQVLKCYGNEAALIACRLETGRTHQIRAHMKHLGHPLFGDTRYGGDRILRGQGSKYKRMVVHALKALNGQALHAYTLGFAHPRTGDRMDYEAPWPPEFALAVHKWRAYTQTPPHTSISHIPITEATPSE